jgi:hypothetical protein
VNGGGREQRNSAGNCKIAEILAKSHLPLLLHVIGSERIGTIAGIAFTCKLGLGACRHASSPRFEKTYDWDRVVCPFFNKLLWNRPAFCNFMDGLNL